MTKVLPKELADVVRAKLQSLKRKVVLSTLSKELIDVVRLQMLYNISNGWSYHAYKRLGPEGIIEVELEMWERLLPAAVERLMPFVEAKGPSIGRARSLLGFVNQISDYRARFSDESATSLTWEYSRCPNWDSMLELDLDDYITQNGEPARVSCIHGCTRIHEIYFRGIDPAITVHSLGNRPAGDGTCTFRIELENP
jgi:hypothetical protein